MAHTTNTIVVTCIDFRFQKFIEAWLTKNVGPKNYDRVAWAGGVIDLYGILKQVDVSVRLHAIKKAIFINHEDCGAYGVAGTPDKHRADLLSARTKIHVLYPELDAILYYLHLDGTFEEIK